MRLELFKKETTRTIDKLLHNDFERDIFLNLCEELKEILAK